MGDVVLEVVGLGKRYRIGAQAVAATGMYQYKSLRDAVVPALKRPLVALQRLFVRQPSADDDGFWALRDVEFEVRRGEVVGIIGRNGAGKSTLLKVLSRITKPTTGRADLYGRVGSLLEVGTGFHPELSGRENIYLNGAILGMTRAEVRSKFDEIVAFSEVERFLDTPVKQYSSGMYMRLAFAVAAHLEPEILVVDEVLAVGDAAFQRKCLGKMKAVADEGRTVLFVSHNLSQVRRLCTTAIVLNAGRIHSSGEVGEQLAAYSRLVGDQRGAAGPTKLLRDVSVAACTVEPPVFYSGSGTTVTIILRATVATNIEELAVFVCRDVDARVAMMDLNGPVVPMPMAAGETRAFRVEVGRLPIVEGEYSIGLFCKSAAGFDAVYGLADLQVLPPDRIGRATVYPPRDRGSLEVTYEGTSTICSDPSDASTSAAAVIES